jgi:hypothetical protein
MSFAITPSSKSAGVKPGPDTLGGQMMFPGTNLATDSFAKEQAELFKKAMQTPLAIENAPVFAEIIQKIGSAGSHFAAPTGTVVYIGGKSRAGVIRWLPRSDKKLHLWGNDGQVFSLMGLGMTGEVDLRTLMVSLQDGRVVPLQELTGPQRDAILRNLQSAATISTRFGFTENSSG